MRSGARAMKMIGSESVETHGLDADGAQIPFRRLFDAAPACISIHAGADHRYIYTNPAHDRLIGGTSLVGRTLADAASAMRAGDLIAKFDAAFTVGSVIETAELQVYLPDADGTPTARHFNHVLQPWHDDAGTIRGVMSFAYDVTSHVAARGRAEASERHLSYALDMGAVIGTFDWDTKRDHVDVDARFLKAFGMDHDRINGDLPVASFFAAIHSEDRDRVAAAISRAVATGDDYEEEFRVTGQAGDERFVLARGRCLHDATGQPDHFTGVVIDQTRQYRNEQALRESEARMRSVFSSIDQGYCLAEIVFDANETPVDYRFLEVNPQFEEMSGLKDATGRRMLELVPDLEDKWVKTYARVALEGESIRFEDHSPVMNRWFDVFAMPALTRGQFAVVFKDTTRERQIRQTLQQSEAEFRTITEAMPQIVWATRPDGYHDFYNARWYEFTGMPEGSTDGEGWQGLFHEEDQPEALKRWHHALKTGDPYEIEYRLRHHTGPYRWVLGRAQPVRDLDGRIIRWLGTCTDIHDIKMAEEQRKLMLGEMNHRVKNTLSMVHAIVSQTLRQSRDIKEASAAVQLRLAMMAQAHDRLVHATWTETRIVDVVDAALAPHHAGPGRLTVDGPDLALGSKQALALTMALHELATNATKYGAFSGDLGHVSIAWSVDPDGRFGFTWTERDGPEVVPPARRGFGSRMIEQALSGYFGGAAELIFNPEGLMFRMTSPVTGLSA